jgi:hypothetical protein
LANGWADVKAEHSRMMGRGTRPTLHPGMRCKKGREMDKPRRPSIAERLADHARIEAAIKRAVREAVLASARAGYSVAEWRDGKVVWVSPEEVLRQWAESPPGNGE